MSRLQQKSIFPHVTRAVGHGRESVCQCPVTHGGADKEPNSYSVCIAKTWAELSPCLTRAGYLAGHLRGAGCITHAGNLQVVWERVCELGNRASNCL